MLWRKTNDDDDDDDDKENGNTKKYNRWTLLFEKLKTILNDEWMERIKNW